MEKLRAEITARIQGCLSEFVSGAISREQFHALYRYYHAQRVLLEARVQHGQTGTLHAGTSRVVREAHKARLSGLQILGDSGGVLFSQPTLHDAAAVLERWRAEAEGPRWLEDSGEERWSLVTQRSHSLVITQFVREPSRMQLLLMDSLHDDFETANQAALAAGAADGASLANPFLALSGKHSRRD
ncbi:MAG: hypothetical protein KME04_04625 [Pleurocapsa minor GSE-CHR-MK-17-07R]|nr:hypothetical protein [Pleurocapsa minor GSE-CHR-MK 17-07R]